MKHIFIHGLGQSQSDWEKTIACMGNTAGISHPDLFSLLNEKEMNYENLFLAFCEYIGKNSEPVSLIGLSLGAVLALHYTIDYPENVQSLVLIAPQFKMPKNLLKMQNAIFRLMPDSTFQKLGSSKKDFITLSKSMMDLDFSEDVKNVQCRTLILYGEKDRANKKAAKQLSELIPDAKMTKILGAGHEINKDAPEKLAAILDEFLYPSL